VGWWASADGAGIIGDRPADILGMALSDALGPRYDVELLGGFLAAVGGALLRNPTELVCDKIVPGSELVAEFAEEPAIAVPVQAPPVSTGLDDAVHDALEAAAFQYRTTSLDRAPRLDEILETIALVARGHVVDTAGRPLELERIRARAGADRLTETVAPFAWAAMKALVTSRDPIGSAVEAVVAHTLADSDWRARMTALLVVGRLRLGSLARRAASVEVPPESEGVRDVDRRALLALRDVAAARAAGAELERPLHPDPDLAERRGAFVAEVQAAVEGTTLPGPESPAYVLRGLIDPGAVLAEGRMPTAWKVWLPG
jgi:hypothetical protein